MQVSLICLCFQRIAYMNTESAEYDQQRLSHRDGEAERFYGSLGSV